MHVLNPHPSTATAASGSLLASMPCRPISFRRFRALTLPEGRGGSITFDCGDRRLDFYSYVGGPFILPPHGTIKLHRCNVSVYKDYPASVSPDDEQWTLQGMFGNATHINIEATDSRLQVWAEVRSPPCYASYNEGI